MIDNITPTHILVDLRTRIVVGSGFIGGSNDPNLEVVELTPEQLEQFATLRANPNLADIVYNEDGTFSGEAIAPIAPPPNQAQTVTLQAQTTDATPVVIYTHGLEPNSVTSGIATFTLVDNDNDLMQAVQVRFAFKRLKNGAKVAGAPQFATPVGDAIAGYDITQNIVATASGNDITITVTGIAGHTFHWTVVGDWLVHLNG